MSDILAKINQLDNEIFNLRARFRFRRHGERERVRELAAQVRNLWHQRRVELAGLDEPLYAYEDIMHQPHMIDMQHVPGAGEWRVRDTNDHYHDATIIMAETVDELRIKRAQRWQRKRGAEDCVQLPMVGVA